MNAQELIDTARRDWSPATKVYWRWTRVPRPATNASPRWVFRKPRRLAAPIASCIVTTPGLGECISGAILYDETIRQKKRDGSPFAAR